MNIGSGFILILSAYKITLKTISLFIEITIPIYYNYLTNRFGCDK